MIQGTFDDPFANFMTVTRATVVTDDNETPFDPTDDINYHTNQTTPFIDQNQTYTSHPSHQVFLREYDTECRREAGCNWPTVRRRERRASDLGGDQSPSRDEARHPAR